MKNRKHNDTNNKKNNAVRNDRDALLERLGMKISRRSMLKGMGLGLAGALFAPSLLKGQSAAPRARVAPLSAFGAPPPTGWQYTLNNLANSPSFENGRVTFPTVVYSKTGVPTFTLNGVDIQDGSDSYNYQLPAGLVVDGDTLPLVINQTLYFTTSSPSAVYALNTTTGAVLWSRPYTVVSRHFTPVGGNILFAAFAANNSGISFYAVDPNGDEIWHYDTNNGVNEVNGAVWTLISNGLAVFAVNSTFYSFDVESGRFVTSAPMEGDLSGTVPEVGSQLAVYNVNAYYVTDGGEKLQNFNLSFYAGNEGWPIKPANGIFTSPPTYYNGAVYVASSGGVFNAYDPNTGALLWSCTVQGGEIDDSIFVEDGVAFFVAGTSIWAMELTSQGTDLVSYTIPAGDQNPFIIDVEAGVCYFFAQSGVNGLTPYIQGTNLGNEAHQFFCESELMVEDYAGNSTSYAPSTPSYRTHVKLVDPNKNPLPNQSVKLWASDEVTLLYQGQSIQIDPITPFWFNADAAGEISIVTTAPTVSCPALMLWSSFMDAEDAIVIYPDHDALNTLSNVQGSDLTSTTQTSYDGQPLLSSTYSTADDLATSIRTTMGAGVSAAMLKTKQMHQSKTSRTKTSQGSLTDTPYIAYPSSAPNMSYLPNGISSDRAYVAGSILQWNAVFDASGNVTFTPSLPIQAPQLGSILGDFKKLGHDVANGLAKASHVIWDDVAKIVKVIVNEAGDLYQDTVDSIEKAISVVASLLAAVISDIKKAVEWLSSLFDWDAMLTNHTLFKNSINSNLDAAQNWATTLTSEAIQDIHTFFTTIEGDVAGAFTSVNTAIGGQSLQSQQQNGNDPQTIYGHGGAKSYTKTNWLMSKAKDNASSSSLAARRGAPSDGGAYDEFVTAIKGFFDDVAAQLETSTFENIPEDLKNIFSDFALLASKPSEFVTKGVSDILNLLSDIIVGLLQLIDAVVESLLAKLPDFIGIIKTILNQTINIPFISDFYSLITHGSQLSILDLLCLIMAIPATIIYRAINGESQGRLTGLARRPDGTISIDTLGAIIAGLPYVILDALSDLVKEFSTVMKVFYLASNITLWSFSLADDIFEGETSASDVMFAVLQLVPPILTGGNYAFAAAGVTDPALIAWKEGFDALTPLGLGCYGVFMIGFTVTKYSDQTLELIQNLFGFLPYIFKQLGNGPDFSPQRIALGVIDGVGDLTSIIIGAVEDFEHSGSAQRVPLRPSFAR